MADAVPFNIPKKRFPNAPWTDHWLVSEEMRKVKPIEKPDISQKASRISDHYESNREAYKVNVRTTPMARPSRLIFLDDIKKMKGSVSLFMKNNPWIRRTGYLALGIVGLSFARSALSHIFTSQRTIPNEYDQGYDVIKENMTDFGSPVKLAKAAHKVITPYYSSIRKNGITTVESVLGRSPTRITAINHNRY